MAGRFEGLSDMAWQLFVDLFPPEPTRRGRGMPHVPFRKVVNTLRYILSTGCRWCDVPQGPQWASQSAAHRWLRRWHDAGTLATVHARLLGLAEARGMLNWHYGAVDGAFSLWHRRRCRGRPWWERDRHAHSSPHRWGRHAVSHYHDAS